MVPTFLIPFWEGRIFGTVNCMWAQRRQGVFGREITFGGGFTWGQLIIGKRRFGGILWKRFVWGAIPFGRKVFEGFRGVNRTIAWVKPKCCPLRGGFARIGVERNLVDMGILEQGTHGRLFVMGAKG